MTKKRNALPLLLITANLLALGIAAVAFKNGNTIFKTTSVKPDPTAGRGTPKSPFRMTKKREWLTAIYNNPEPTCIRDCSGSFNQLIGKNSRPGQIGL